MNPLISLKDISATYGAKTVFSNVNLTVYERDFLGIVGPNGGGKTTLVRLLLGLLTPSSGEVTYHEGTLPMGYLPQSETLDRSFPVTVREVVLSGLSGQKSLFSRFSKTQHEQVAATLQRLELLPLADNSISQLSGGQLQRVLLARAIVSKPRLLVLDEPNTWMDVHHQRQMATLLNELSEECAIVMVSHDLSSVVKQARHIAYVDHGLTYFETDETGRRQLEEWF